jgi:hypothetical protein
MSLSLRTLCCALLAAPLGVAPATAQPVDAAGAWRALAERVDPGTEVKMRLRNGQHFTATLIAAEPDAIVIQPKTRRPVPVQRVGYDAIASLERRDARGIGAAKAAAIGVASGAGAFLAVLAILAAVYGD